MTWRVESGLPAPARSAAATGPATAPTVPIAETICPVPAEDWDRIYCSDPDALPTQSRAWAGALVRAGFVDRSRLYTFADGQQAVVPLFARRYPANLMGRLWSPPAAWGFGGPLSDHKLDSLRLGAILRDLEGLPSLGVRLRPNPLHADVWAGASATWERLERTAHVLDLSGGMQAVWETRFKPRTRTATRKAQTEDVAIVCGRSDDLIAEFYDLFEKSVIRWADKQREPARLALWRARRRDPIAKFHAMAAAMGDAFRLSIARHQGRAVAAILVLQDSNAHYTRGAMDETLAGPISANLLLHHHAIEAACAAGCRYYHMGETGQSAALAQFKSRFGATGVAYAEYFKEKLPITGLTNSTKNFVKKVIGFSDA
jgi:hypothetical protein